ncbi:cholesterol transporter ABCA5-like isoform X2 [Watersipora subatra]|uniref:cholesterol transporter ABCA5-like isoform X2 n=1 Tax=Watersipora subatra TaxID=2589382 RepID=UPI00355B4549
MGLWKVQFKALLKRNYLIKRRYISGVVWEFLLPVLFLVMFGLINLGSPKQKSPNIEWDADPIDRPTNGSIELLAAPNTSDSRQIADGVCKELNCTYTMFTDAEAAKDSYLSNISNTKFGLIFDGQDSSYTIRLTKDIVRLDLFSYDVADCSYDDICPSRQYITSGMAALQAAVDHEIVKLKNASAISPQLQGQLMPEYRRDAVRLNQTLRFMLPFYMIYAMGFVGMFLTYSAVDDKVKNRRDHLTMMGMAPSAYWAAGCVVNLPLSFVICCAGVLILALFNFFSTSLAYVYFFFALLIYAMNSILIGICWSAVLPKTEYIFVTIFGTVALGAIGLVNMIWTDYLTDPWQPQSPLVIGGIICLIPPAGFASILERMFVLSYRYEGGLVAGSFTAGNLSLVVMLVILIVDIFLLAAFAMWLEGILPNSLGGKLPLCFCFDRKYWKPEPVDPEVVRSYELNVELDEDADVEPVPRSMASKAAVRLFNMKKEFVQSNGCSGTERVQAVQGVTLDIYEGQITALLGHNGAGKTTLINMMTGIMPVTSGSATLYGYDVSNGVDLQAIRGMIGICPQKDVIVERLTVREHLELYAHLKGVPEKEVADKIRKTVADCDLVEQIDTRAEKLSGGQKRKLNVGMALIGNPKILFLDEPTAGMDPYSRRHLWSLLKNSREGRVILLTTHFMDEADVLADRKAVISKGRLQCAGSSLYMKNKFGVGYQLTLLVEDARKQEVLGSLIAEVIEDSTHKRTFGKEITYNLPIQQSAKFSDLFMALESHKEELSVTSYSIAMITLEEVFLKLGEQAEEEERLDKENLQGRQIKNATSVHPEVEERFQASEEDNPINMERTNVATNRRRLWHMVRLRLKMIPREGFLIVSLILYLIALAAGVVLIVVSTDGISQASPPKNVTLDVINSTTSSYDDKFAASDVVYSNKSSANIDGLLDPIRTAVSPPYFLSDYNGDYSKTYPPVAPFGYDINTFSTAINTTLSEWPSAEGIVYAFNTGSFAGMSFVFAVYVGSSFYTVYIVGEREKKLKPLLRTAGVTVNTYFGTYAILYLILLGPPLLIAAIVIIAFQVPGFQAPLAAILLILHILIQLIVIILLSFCWSYVFDKPQTAGNVSNINIWLTLLFFTPVTILINIPSTVQIAKLLHHVFCIIIPYYSFPGGLLMFLETHRSYLLEVNDLSATVPSIAYIEPKNGILSALIGGLIWIFLLFVFLRIGEIKVTEGQISDVFKCFANNLSRYNPMAHNVDVISEEDNDVAVEREKVHQIWQDTSQDVVMKASRLRKEFVRGKQKSDKVAVRNMTFHVEEGEVFGLLGPNGAGKTTVLNMIIAEHAPTAGQVMVDNIEVHSALSEAFEIIGYCPQFDALWPDVTPNELMIFIGISSGLSESQAKAAANYYIKMLKIEEHRDKFTKNLSGGTQRKVSFALALLGWPRLVLLDEPSTGLDPSSKRFLWDTIRSSFNGHSRSAILTTHYMEEADALCTRIGIMVNGALECLGSAQHLKDKFGDGYHLEVKLQDSADSQGDMDRLKAFVEQTFHESVVIEEFADRIQYAMPAKVVSSPGQVFGPIEENKESLKIEEYSFSQSTLEQVFLQFAKQQLQEDEDEENAEKLRERTTQILKKQKSLSSAAQQTHL